MIGHRSVLSVLVLASSIMAWGVPEAQFIPDELLVKFKPGTAQLVVHEVNTKIGAFILDRSIGDPDLYRVQIRPGLDLEKAIQQYESNPNVVRASKNSLVGIPEERGDGFDDIVDGARFFSEDPSRLRWAAAQNGRCDLLVQRPGIGTDRVIETLFFGRAGDSSSSWTIATLKIPPVETSFRSVAMGVSTADGSPFSGKHGRIGIGFVEGTGVTARTCRLTGLSYDEQSFASSLVAGVHLDSAQPFWHTDPPYTERTYPRIDIANLSGITIFIALDGQDLTLRILKSDTGADIFKTSETLPLWNSSGTRTPVFVHYGVADGSTGRLHVHWLSAQ